MIRKRTGPRGVSYQVSVDLGFDADGHRRRHTSTHRTKKEAEAEERRLKTELADQTYVRPSKETVAVYLRRWLASTRLAPRSARRAAQILDTYWLPAIGHLPLVQLRPAHIVDAEAAWLRGEGRPRPLSTASVLKHHAILHRALRMAVRWGVLAANPADAVEPPRRGHFEPVVLDEAGLVRLLAALAAHRFCLAFQLDAFTAMRGGEILGLRWADVDLERQRLVVRRAWDSQDQAFAPVKAHRSQRPIDLDGDTVALLRAHQAHQLAERQQLGAAWTDLDLVCTDAEALGRPWHWSSVYHAFKRLASAAGFPARLRPHDLRHAHASLLLAAGVAPNTVQERLGHHSAAFTLSVYGHVIPGRQRAAAEAFRALLRPSDANLPPRAAESLPTGTDNGPT